MYSVNWTKLYSYQVENLYFRWICKRGYVSRPGRPEIEILPAAYRSNGMRGRAVSFSRILHYSRTERFLDHCVCLEFFVKMAHPSVSSVSQRWDLLLIQLFSRRVT